MSPRVAHLVGACALIAVCRGDPASAADPRYALAAELAVDTPAPVRIDLPPAWVAACPDPSTYRVEDAAGDEVPFASRTSDDAPPGPEPLTWEPVERSAWSWTYLVHPPESGSPTVAISVRGLPRDRVVEAVVSEAGERVATALVWNLPDTGAGVSDRIRLPPGHRRGPWRVELHTVNFWRTRPWAEFEAITTGAEQVDVALWQVDSEAPVVTGPHTSRLSLRLPRGGLPVRGVRIDARDPMFSRPAVVIDGRGGAVGRGELRRFPYGDATIDLDRIAVRTDASRDLSVDLTDDRSVPLDVGAVELELRGIALLTRGGAPGRWTIAGCGPAGGRYDLERLGTALHRTVAATVSPGPPRANDAWTLSLVTEGVAGPGAPVPGDAAVIGRVALARPDADAGDTLVRVPVPPDVLSVTQADLGDLRIVDGAGRQIPYLRADAPDGPVDGVRHAITEEGAVTVMRIALPEPGLPVHQLVLHAERARFHRDVVVDTGNQRINVAWDGSGDGVSRLIVPLTGRALGTIDVRIDNGDNPPLPLVPPSLSMANTDLWLVLPRGGADVRRISAGARARSKVAPPVYDLALLQSEVIDGPALDGVIEAMPTAASAPIAPPSSVAGAPARALPGASPEPAHVAPPPRRRWVPAAVAACALALAGLALRLRAD